MIDEIDVIRSIDSAIGNYLAQGEFNEFDYEGKIRYDRPIPRLSGIVSFIILKYAPHYNNHSVTLDARGISKLLLSSNGEQDT